MKFRHLAMAMGSVMVLAACAADPGYEATYYSEDAVPASACAGMHAEALKGVNWATAKPIDITIQDGIYSPATIAMAHGQPYLLRYDNEDEDVRAVASNEFFTRAAVGSVIVDGQVNKPGACLLRVKLAPKTMTMVQIVPLREGRYGWTDNLGPSAAIWFSRKDTGDIIVR